MAIFRSIGASLAGHLCRKSGQSDDDPDDTPEWTPPQRKGFDELSPDGDGDPNGGTPLSWHALSPEAHPLPIFYGADWTRNHISPENDLAIRHPQDGTALPWLAQYPNDGVHLFHAVVHHGGRARKVEQLIGRFWKSTAQHSFRTNQGVSRKTWATTCPKYISGNESVSASISAFLLDVESHCLSFGVYVPARETIMKDAQLGTLFTYLPIHVQVECVDSFDLKLYECLRKDPLLCKAFPTKFHIRSGYHIIYELAVLAQLPMLSLVGFEAVHTPPVMDDKDTIEAYTKRWQFWFDAASHIGWVYSDRWFLNEYVRGLHRSLSKMGALLLTAANTSCRNVNSANPEKFSLTELGHTFTGIISSCPSAIDISGTTARMLAASLPIESISPFVEDEIPLAEGDHVVAALEPDRPGRIKPRIRFQNKVDNAGNKMCNVCGSSDHLYANCPVRPNPVNELGAAIYNAYQVAAAQPGPDESLFEFVQPVAIYELSPDFR